MFLLQLSHTGASSIHKKCFSCSYNFAEEKHSLLFACFLLALDIFKVTGITLFLEKQSSALFTFLKWKNNFCFLYMFLLSESQEELLPISSSPCGKARGHPGQATIQHMAFLHCKALPNQGSVCLH